MVIHGQNFNDSGAFGLRARKKEKKNINGLGLLKKTPGKVITAMAALMVVKLTPVLSAMGGDEPQKEA